MRVGPDDDEHTHHMRTKQAQLPIAGRLRKAVVAARRHGHGDVMRASETGFIERLGSNA